MSNSKRNPRPDKTAATASRTRQWLPRNAKTKVPANQEDEQESVTSSKPKQTSKSTKPANGRSAKQTKQPTIIEEEDDDEPDVTDDEPGTDSEDEHVSKRKQKRKATATRRKTAAKRTRQAEPDEDDSDFSIDDMAPLTTAHSRARVMAGIETALTNTWGAVTGLHPVATDTCGTCDGQYPEKDMVKPSEIPDSCRGCYPRICRGCMENLLDIYFFQTSYSMECPYCAHPWALSSIESLLGKKKLQNQLDRMNHRLLESDPYFRWCAAEKCTGGQFYNPDEQLKDGNVKICCGFCESVNCYQCRSVWHEGLTCEEFKDPDLRKHRGKRQSDTEVVKAMRRAETRRCPCCSAAVEKDGGCDHVICYTCGQDFAFSQAVRI